MATKRKTKAKRPSRAKRPSSAKRPSRAKGQTKKDLESKIAQLEAKLTKLSADVGGKAETKAPPPPPKPETKAPPPPQQAPPPPPKPEIKAPPKPAEKAAPPANLSQALENLWQNYPMSSTHDFKAKVTGFSPNPNRYHGRRIAPGGTAPTNNWNIQKAVVTGFTACSNQYFATRARMCYHPADKNFTGYGLQIEGATAQTQSAPPPPPPPAEAQPEPSSAGSGKSSKQAELEAYEKDYVARMANKPQEQAKATEAKSKPSSKAGALPKGF